MERKTHANGVVTYLFDSLAGHAVQAHVSTRHGGVSPAPWATLNFSVSRGDSLERVRANRVRFAQAVGIDPTQLVVCHQVHGTQVVRVDRSHTGTTQAATDGLITDAVDVPLGLVFADCVPVLLYDPVHHAVGICHAGWRGTIDGTAVATLRAMQAAFGSKPGQVMAAIGPSIGPQSYEGGDEVLAQATAKLPEARRYFSFPNGAGARPHFNLWQANVGQLTAAGMAVEHIEVSGIDTAQRTDDFYSHRAERGQCGLFGMTAWLCDQA